MLRALGHRQASPRAVGAEYPSGGQAPTCELPAWGRVNGRAWAPRVHQDSRCTGQSCAPAPKPGCSEGALRGAPGAGCCAPTLVGRVSRTRFPRRRYGHPYRAAAAPGTFPHKGGVVPPEGHGSLGMEMAAKGKGGWVEGSWGREGSRGTCSPGLGCLPAACRVPGGQGCWGGSAACAITHLLWAGAGVLCGRGLLVCGGVAMPGCGHGRAVVWAWPPLVWAWHAVVRCGHVDMWA